MDGWYREFHYTVKCGRIALMPDGARFAATLNTLHDERKPGHVVPARGIHVEDVRAKERADAISGAEAAIKLAIDRHLDHA